MRWNAIFEGLFCPVMAARQTTSTPQTAAAPSANANLWDASQSGSIGLAREALASGADIQALDVRTNRNGPRALNWAAWNNHPDMIAFLVQNGAQINASNRTGFTALHHAAETNAVDAARKLIELGANPNARTGRGLSPLAIADGNDAEDVAAVIRAAGGR